MSRYGLRAMANGIRAGLGRVEVLAIFPVLALAALWSGQADVLLVSAFLLPVLLAVQAVGSARAPLPGARDSSDGVTGLALRPVLVAAADDVLAEPGRAGAVIMLHIDTMGAVVAQWGAAAAEDVLRRSAERLRDGVREDDVVARIGDAGFGVVMGRMRGTGPEAVLSCVERLQTALSHPVPLGGAVVHVTASVGYCTVGLAPERSGEGLIEAAEIALTDARRAGPGAIRGFTRDLGKRFRSRGDEAARISAALESGQIRAWFQPQVSTDTGAVSGFEALARWHHPDQGVLPPSEFLSTVEAAGLMPRLGEVMLFHALSALQGWDRAGLDIPSVAVNFSGEELRDPKLAGRLRREVDRFDLKPGRLTVEILETVAAQAEDDVIIRTIQQLGAHGFKLDLDDFGTGHASIANIRRFRVNRIKIDRSFVTRLDQDPEQQAMVTAILSMAEHLGLETLAEGVETAGEHAMLAQLGCGHVQGFGLARPMPFEDTIAWSRAHAERWTTSIRIGRQTG